MAVRKRHKKIGPLAACALASLAVSPGMAADIDEVFGSPQQFPLPEPPSGIVAADFTGDGLPDIVVSDPTLPIPGEDGLSLLTGEGSGSFSAAARIDFSVGTDLAVTGLVIAEFNGDEIPDLALVTVIDSGIAGLFEFSSIVTGDGAGGFVYSGDAVLDGPGSHVAIGDLNGNGNLDIAVSPGFFGAVNVSLGNGSGGISTDFLVVADSSLLSGSVAGIASGDLDGDNRDDLVVVNPGFSQITVVYGDGQNDFFDLDHYPLADMPTDVALGHLDDDLHLDVFVVSAGASVVTTLRNDGTGNLLAPRTFATAGGSSEVVLDDFDLDGVRDAVITLDSADQLQLLLGDGLGGFAAPPVSTVAVGDEPRHLAVADVNMDGRPDVIAGNRLSEDVSVLLNASDAVLASRVVPDRGGDDGEIDIRVLGAGFADGATVTLHRTGEADLVASPVVVPSGAEIVARLDLRNAPLGAWHVVVDNPGAPAITLPDVFTVEAGRAPVVWAELIGRDVFRPGRTQRYQIVYGNSGNTTASVARLRLTGLPPDAQVNALFDYDTVAWPNVAGAGNPDAPLMESDAGVALTLNVFNIHPGAPTVLPFDLTLPGNQPVLLRLEVIGVTP